MKPNTASPDANAIIAGALPLYGTCTVLMPVPELNICVTRCPALTEPADE